MSRPALAVQIDDCDLSKPVEAQASDPEIQPFPDFKTFHLSGDNQFVMCDISTFYPTPFFSCKLRRSIFKAFIQYHILK